MRNVRFFALLAGLSAAVLLICPRVFAQTIPIRTGELVSIQGMDGGTKPLPSNFFPLSNLAATKAYWGRSDVASLQNTSLAYSTDRFSIYSELVTDYWNLFGLYWRIGLGGLVANSDTSKTKDSTSASAQRFFAGGGNALLSFVTPLWSNKSLAKGGASLDFLLYPKIEFDIPGMSTEATKFNGSVDIGIEGIWSSPSVNDTFRFTIESRVGYATGSGQFYSNLGVDHPFGYAKALLGVDISNAFRITTAEMGSMYSSLIRLPNLVA